MVDTGSHILMRPAEFMDGFPAALFRSTLEGTIVDIEKSILTTDREDQA